MRYVFNFYKKIEMCNATKIKGCDIALCIMSFLVQKLWLDVDGIVRQDYVEYVWKRMCDRDEDQAREWLTANKDGLKEMEAQWREKKKEREALVNMYCFEENGKDKPVVLPNQQEPETKVRYLNGQVVSTKGEKFIVEKTDKEWDGGSRGKVYTKGKRGKGFV